MQDAETEQCEAGGLPVQSPERAISKQCRPRQAEHTADRTEATVPRTESRQERQGKKGEHSKSPSRTGQEYIVSIAESEIFK